MPFEILTYDSLRFKFRYTGKMFTTTVQYSYYYEALLISVAGNKHYHVIAILPLNVSLL